MTHQTNLQSINAKQPIRALAQGLAEDITEALNAGALPGLGSPPIQDITMEELPEAHQWMHHTFTPDGALVLWAPWKWDFIGQIGGGLVFRTEGYLGLADAQGKVQPVFELEFRFERLAREVSRVLIGDMPPMQDDLKKAVERAGAQIRLVDARTGEAVPGAVFDFQSGRWTVDLGEGPELL